MLIILKELILQNFKSSDGKLIYISGEIISSDLDQGANFEWVYI